MSPRHFIVLFLLLSSAAARADALSDPIRSSQIAKAKEASDAGDHVAAIHILEAIVSQDIEPRAETLYFLADELEEVGDLTSAWDYARRCTQVAGARSDLVEGCSELQNRVEPQIAKVHLTLPSDVKDVRLTLNLQQVTITEACFVSCVVWTNPGQVDIVATAPDHVDFYKRLNLQDGQEETVTVDLLVKEKAPPEKQSGFAVFNLDFVGVRYKARNGGVSDSGGANFNLLLVQPAPIGPAMNLGFGAQWGGADFHIGFGLGASGSVGSLVLTGGGGADGTRLGLTKAFYAFAQADGDLRFAPWLRMFSSTRYAWRTSDSSERQMSGGFAVGCFGDDDCFQLTASAFVADYPGVDVRATGATVGIAAVLDFSRKGGVSAQ